MNKTVVVRRALALGDVILTTPVVRALKRDGYSVHVVTCHPLVYLGNKDVTWAGYNTQAPADATFVDLDLAYEMQPNLHVIDAYALRVMQTLGTNFAVTDRQPLLFPQPRHFREARELLGEGRRWVALHVGPTRWSGRNWPPERFEEVARRLQDDGFRTVVVGTSQDCTIRAATIDARGAALHDTAALLSLCRLFVGLDSGPMHVAQAVGTPVVAPFGAIDPKRRLLNDPRFVGVHADPKEYPCVGEHHRLRPPCCQSQCSTDGACMKAVTVEMVMAEATRLLEAFAPPATVA